MHRIIALLKEIDANLVTIEKDLRHRDNSAYVFARHKVNEAGMAIVAAIVTIQEEMEEESCKA